MLTSIIDPVQPYTRERSQELVSPENITYSDTNTWYSGTVSDPWKISSSVTTNGSSDLWKGEQVMRDVVTTNFRKQINSGVIINNPMEKICEQVFRGVGEYHLHRTNRYGTYPNYYYSGQHRNGTMGIGNPTLADTSFAYPPIPSILTDPVGIAITDMWSKVSFNEAQILTQLAESDKTVRSLISIFKKALKIFKHVKNIQTAALVKDFRPSELKDMYMEARYALRPLVYDAIGTVRAIRDIAQGAPDRQTFRAFKFAERTVTDSDVLLYDSPFQYQIRGTTRATRTLECRAGILASIEFLDFPLMKMGYTELPQAIWEITPFSFIVDWFFNVGKFLASWSPKIGFHVLASWVVVTDTTILESTAVPDMCVPLWSYNYENYYKRGGTYYKVITRKNRYPNPDRPLLPTFDVNIDWLKTLDFGIIFGQIAKFWGSSQHLRT